jgi:H+-transporting ATPase
VDVLCSDKTGTLTANQLSLNEPYVAEGVDINWCVIFGRSPNGRAVVNHFGSPRMMCVAALASSHNIKSLYVRSIRSSTLNTPTNICLCSDPIDKVTIVGLKDYPKAREMLKDGWTTHKFTPFDPISKRITAEVEQNGKKFTCAKGAPNAFVFPWFRLTRLTESVLRHDTVSSNCAVRAERLLTITSR